jgi:hypothetical protein
MPICPKCNYEYIEGMTLCPDCKTALVAVVELEKFDELSEDDWVLVYTSFYEFDIDMLKSNLEGAGIAVSKLSQKDHSFPAPGDLSVVKLLVKKNDVQEALEFIQDLKQKETDSEEDESE